MIEFDPAYPVLWRDARRMQIGVSPALYTIEDPTAWQLGLIDALMRGVSAGQIAGLATALGGTGAEATDFVGRISGALREALAPRRLSLLATERVPHDAILGVCDALVDAGFEPVRRTASRAAANPEDIAVIVSTSLVPPHLARELVAADVVHVPLVLDAERAVLGPAVYPGATACLACVWAHERDLDPAWPTLASQLVTRDLATSPSRALASATAALLPRVIQGASPRSGRSRAVHVTRDGYRRWVSHALHAECLCRSLPENATELARLDPQLAPTTA